MSYYGTIYRIFSPLVRRLYRIEAVGTENIPAAAGRQVRYMAKKELFVTPLGPLIRSLGAYPVDRGGSDVTSIRTTIRLAEEGDLVV